MSMLDVHAKALESVDEVFHLFLLSYKEGTKVVYGIVEGKDDPMFYRSAIERFIPEDWNVDLIRGGNKAKVLQTFAEFDWQRFSPTRIAFFVDSDLDRFCNAPLVVADNVYHTDGYSIENSIVNADLFMRVLVEVFNLRDLTRKDADELKTKFNDSLRQFQHALAYVMAQIIIWRTDGAKANLNQLDLLPMFQFDKGEIQRSPAFSESMSRVVHAAKCVGAEAAPESRIEQVLSEFEASGGPASFTRGKYLIWLLGKLSSHVHESIASISSTYRTSPKLQITVGPNNIMVVAAPRARCPRSLRKFVEKTFLRHIATFESALSA